MKRGKVLVFYFEKTKKGAENPKKYHDQLTDCY
jgi:hypothetical protein